MVIDTSAVLAILQLEPEAESFAQRIDAAEVRRISSVAILEAGNVVEARKGRVGAQELDAFVQQGGFVIEPFDAEQAEVARDAYRRFGKGRHEAALNLGDCASYALAKSFGEPLLFKGTDFPRTDVIVEST